MDLPPGHYSNSQGLRTLGQEGSSPSPTMRTPQDYAGINNVGMGLQFAADGAKVYEAVRHEALGHELPTEWFTETVHPWRVNRHEYLPSQERGAPVVAEMMRAIRYHQTGEADVLQVDEVPRPEPGEGEILVQVRSAGVNPVDSAIRRGTFGQATLPATPGRDVAGTVEAVGPGVTAFRPGQEVFGIGRGTYAEYTIATANSLAMKPANLSFDEAATVALGALTAWTGLFDFADLQPGQRLLVHGGAGGVGIYAVQLGKWKGAEVIATASAANLDLVKSLGADQVIDYDATSFESVVKDADVVLSSVGGETLERSLLVLKRGGTLVAIAGRPPEEKAAELGVRVGRVSATPRADVMERFGEMLAQGRLRAVVRAVFPFEGAADAMQLSETGHGRGHIVIKVAA